MNTTKIIFILSFAQVVGEANYNTRFGITGCLYLDSQQASVTSLMGNDYQIFVIL